MLLLVLALAQEPTEGIQLKPGMVITQSVVVEPKTYRLSGPPIRIRGDNITVDFRGAVLEGIGPEVEPDQATDTAIVIEGGKAIRLEDARIRGYKIGILARGTRGLELVDNNLSDNWKPRLFSLFEHESLVDWLSFHHNENREWLRFGAGVYLEDVKHGFLRDNTIEHGMNGVLLVRSDSLTIRNNNFSFNSGLGIGLYRSSDDSIIHNRLDYNVRGYSHGRYTRGQDSADLLLYEQSSRNVVAFNSMTHGGDGIFLWAGQTAMDSGKVGANDNLFYGNDVSYSTANGVEITFSRNTVIANKAWGGEYGVWGGYSYQTDISGNDFKGNRTGIAIEHGQDNTIIGNKFDGDSTAIRLWADTIVAADWGYPKYHRTCSCDYRIARNDFLGNTTTLNVRNTSGLDTSITQGPLFREVSRLMKDSVPSTELSLAPRSSIIVDEWGPYDWRTPKLWYVGRDTTDFSRYRLVVLGPHGDRWRLLTEQGVAHLSHSEGFIGDTIVVTADNRADWSVTLVSRGTRFWYVRFAPPIEWKVNFFTWTDSTNYFERLLGDSLHGEPVRRIDYLWYQPPPRLRSLPSRNWSLRATGTVTLPGGTYSLRTISDDAVRAWVDGKLVIDNWTPHESQVDYAPLSAGKHDLRVEYRQVDGWVELRVDIIRGSSRSTGSPGPH